MNLRRKMQVNSKKRKRVVHQLFHGRFHSARFYWESAEDRAWLNMAPVGREFGSPDYDRLMQEDLNEFRSNLSSLIVECRNSCAHSQEPLEPNEGSYAANVQIALHEFGHDVNVAVAAAVWRHQSNALMAGWMTGAETVASAKMTLFLYCTRKFTRSRSFLGADGRAADDFMKDVEDLPIQDAGLGEGIA